MQGATTLDQFIAEWNGKQCEFDGKYEYECVDLVQMYNKECIGAPSWTGNAKDYDNNPRPMFYTRQNNTLLYVPPKGAIAVWSSRRGNGNGHVGIVTSANLLNFVSFDQNWSKPHFTQLENHNYTDVVSFLVPREQNIGGVYNALIGDLRNIVNKYPLLS